MSEEPTGPVPTLFAAIVKQLCVNATYNRDKIVLAPHVAYTKHGELYVDAITVARNGMLPREEKLGSFKVTGLGEPKLTGRAFTISSLYEPEAERYVGSTLVAVESVAAA
ncbi:MAG TPA: hypothetical protein VFO80_06330 [Sphingomonas sp.]|nr:hypothetical protein [Sphingomonas sp.]